MKFSAFAILVLLVVVLGCRVGGRESTTEQSSGAGGGTTSEPAPAGSAGGGKPAETPREEPKREEFRRLEFSSGSIPPTFEYDGSVVDGARWTDANGENTLIVSEHVQRGRDDRSTRYIWGYLFAVRNGSTRLLWKIQDNAENYCDEGKGLVSPIEVRDIDGDGVAENMFVYNVEGACDVSPITFKLMMHSGETKLAVRGTNGVDLPDYRERGQKNFDPSFNSAPGAFRDAASDFWDRHVKPLR